MKKLIKTLLILVLIITMFNTGNIYATDTTDKTGGIDEVINGADDFLNAGKGSEEVIDQNALVDASKDLSNILFVVGMAIALIVGIILGIKFMLASVEEKAEIKEALIAYVLGCVVIFGAFGIWKLVVTIMNGVTA